MIDVDQLRELIVRPALKDIGLWSQAAEDLVIGTAAQESILGTYIKQIRGPALGIYQCEPETHADIIRWLKNNVRLCNVVDAAVGGLRSNDERLMHDLRYATVICRLHYFRRPGAIPDTLRGQAAYWKRHYNTHLGKGTIDQYVDNYMRLVDAK